MRFFVLTVVLAILTGTWASVLRDEPDSKLEKLIQQGREDADMFIRALFRKFTANESRAGGPGISEFLDHAYVRISRRLRNLPKELPSDVMEALDMFVGVPAQVAEKAFDTLSHPRRDERQKLDELGKALQSALAGYVDPVLERVDPYTATVRSAIVTRAQEVNRKIDEILQQQGQTLRTQLDPHIKKLQELQVALQPYLDHTQELIRKGAETIHKHLLKPYIDPIVQLGRKYKQDLKAWAAVPAFSPNP